MRASYAADVLLGYMSDLCEDERSAGWLLDWCSYVEQHFSGDTRLLEFQKAAEGRWIDVPEDQGQDTGPRYIPGVRFQFFDECRFCQQRRKDHDPDEKCLFSSTQYRSIEGLCTLDLNTPTIRTGA